MEVDVLRKRLEQIMKRDDLTMLNVASEADLTEDCVRDFVNGVTEAPRRKTLQGIRRVIDSRELVSTEPAQSTSKAV